MKAQGVVVTGAAGDLGAAIARRFAQEGASLTLVDSKDAFEAEPLISDLRAHGASVRYEQLDVRDAAGITALLESIEPLDVAIGHAGIGRPKPILELDLAELHEHLDVNVAANFHFGQTAAKRMIDQGRRGCIAFTGSWVEDIPWPGLSGYCISKAALKMLAKGLARELAAFGIRVNVVAPGIVDGGETRRQIDRDPVFAQRAHAVIPLGELQTAESVAAALHFVCSAEATYMTGSVLLVDGGCSLFQFETA